MCKSTLGPGARRVTKEIVSSFAILANTSVCVKVAKIETFALSNLVEKGFRKELSHMLKVKEWFKKKKNIFCGFHLFFFFFFFKFEKKKKSFRIMFLMKEFYTKKKINF